MVVPFTKEQLSAELLDQQQQSYQQRKTVDIGEEEIFRTK
jgi:hypothetical protein